MEYDDANANAYAKEQRAKTVAASRSGPSAGADSAARNDTFAQVAGLDAEDEDASDGAPQIVRLASTDSFDWQTYM